MSDTSQAISQIPKVTLVYFHNSNHADISSGDIATNLRFAIKIGETAYEYIVVIKGDVNGDGKIYATDYVRIRNHIMGKTQLSGAHLQAADINNDGQIHATDYVKIRNHIMGKTTIEQK